MEKFQKIMRLAAIRRYVDGSFSEEDILNGNYFDVVEKISLPSDDGNYTEYDVVATVSKNNLNL